MSTYWGDVVVVVVGLFFAYKIEIAHTHNEMKVWTDQTFGFRKMF